MSANSDLLATIPPVGKSGPGIISSNSSVEMSLFSIYAITASITSPKLWVGIFVAIPTAIPSAPLTKMLGTFTGRTTGSFSISSKLGMKSTTSLSKSAKYTSCVNFFNFASV